MTRKKQFSRLILLAGGALLSAASVQAQPGGFGGFGGGQGGPPGMNQRADFRNLTMEQRQEMQEKLRDAMRELSLRMTLNNAGIADKTVQDTIIAFAAAQAEGAQVLRDKNRDLQMALNDNANPNTQIVALQNNFTAAAEDEQDRRAKALALLDQEINFSTQPRLKAVLTILGLTGDAQALAESNNGNMMGVMGSWQGGPGGQGGFGGAQGGQGDGRRQQ